MLGPATAPIRIQSRARLRSARSVSKKHDRCGGLAPHVIDHDVDLGRAGGSAQDKWSPPEEIPAGSRHSPTSAPTRASSWTEDGAAIALTAAAGSEN